jgi:hypothetical protein
MNKRQHIAGSVLLCSITATKLNLAFGVGLFRFFPCHKDFNT